MRWVFQLKVDKVISYSVFLYDPSIPLQLSSTTTYHELVLYMFVALSYWLHTAYDYYDCVPSIDDVLHVE